MKQNFLAFIVIKKAIESVIYQSMKKLILRNKPNLNLNIFVKINCLLLLIFDVVKLKTITYKKLKTIL